MRTATLFNDSDASVTQYTVPAEIGDLFQYSVQVCFNGALLAGTAYLMASNVGGTDDCNYVILSGGTQAITAGTTHIWNVTGASYRWIRVKWVPTGGTGTVSAHLVMKEPINRY